MLKPVIKIFEFSVGSAALNITKNFELDKNIKAIKGVLVTSDRDDQLYYRGSQKIEINKWEYFPEKYASKLLMPGLNVKANDKYYDLGSVNPGNGAIKIVYQDTENSQAAFTSYTVFLYVLGEMEDAL